MDLLKKVDLKNQASTNIKNNGRFDQNRINNKNIHEAQHFLSKNGIVNLHPFSGKHWAEYMYETPFKFLLLAFTNIFCSNVSFKELENLFFFQDNVQGLDSDCAAYCLYEIHSNKK